MIHALVKTGAGAATLVWVAGAAAADVSARQVWDAWQAGLGANAFASLTVDAQEVSDTRVTLTGARLTLDGTEGETTLRFDRLELVSQPDGSVSVTLPGTIPVAFEGDAGGRMTAEVQQAGQTLRVSGTPDAFRHDLTADRIAMAATEIVDRTGTPVDGTVRGAFDGLSVAYVPTRGAVTTQRYDLSASTFDLLVDLVDPQAEGPVVFSARLDNPTLNGEAALPTGFADADLATALAAGFSVRGEYDYDASASLFDFGSGVDAATGTISTGPGRQSFAFAQTGLSYDTEIANARAEIRTSALPVPLTMQVASSTVTLAGPAAPTETPEPFALRYALDGLTLGEEVWALVDPQGAIPRDPASLAVDLSGQGRIFEAEESQANGDAPGVLTSLDVNEVALSLAGAALDVAGALTFDPQDAAGAATVPSPSGTLTVDVTGLNGLIDAVIAAGIVPQDQAMMSRLMLGMFARPVGDDALRSEIEFAPGGGITVNGQRVR